MLGIALLNAKELCYGYRYYYSMVVVPMLKNSILNNNYGIWNCNNIVIVIIKYGCDDFALCFIVTETIFLVLCCEKLFKLSIQNSPLSLYLYYKF